VQGEGVESGIEMAGHGGLLRVFVVNARDDCGLYCPWAGLLAAVAVFEEDS
jgi:hypothetical protein